jgi:hypothetical protein
MSNVRTNAVALALALAGLATIVLTHGVIGRFNTEIGMD